MAGLVQNTKPAMKSEHTYNIGYTKRSEAIIPEAYQSCDLFTARGAMGGVSIVEGIVEPRLQCL